MPNVYLRKELYDEIVKRGFDVSEYVNRLVEEALRKEVKK
jgi:post-segregation antitoxin (ccd killing protein)